VREIQRKSSSLRAAKLTPCASIFYPQAICFQYFAGISSIDFSQLKQSMDFSGNDEKIVGGDPPPQRAKRNVSAPLISLLKWLKGST
jgi:hypothetical protein